MIIVRQSFTTTYRFMFLATLLILAQTSPICASKEISSSSLSQRWLTYVHKYHMGKSPVLLASLLVLVPGCTLIAQSYGESIIQQIKTLFAGSNQVPLPQENPVAAVRSITSQPAVAQKAPEIMPIDEEKWAEFAAFFIIGGISASPVVWYT